MARWDTDAGCDVLCDLHEARDLLAEALRKSRESVLPSSGRISNAMREAEEAIDTLTAALRRAGVLE